MDLQPPQAPVRVWDPTTYGVELATAFGETEEEVNATLGLVYDETKAQWMAPKVRDLLAQKITVGDLDDEELARGQVRDSDGKFRGGPARRIPREFHEELMRRVLMIGTEKLRAHYLTGIETIVDIMEDELTEPALRARLAIYVTERLAGKTPDRVEATVTVKPWEVALKGIIRELPEGDIIDGEIVEDDD